MPQTEMEQWLSLRRLALSEFMGVLFAGIHGKVWTDLEAQSIGAVAVNCFGNGCCYYLASVVSQTSGWPIAGFWRKGGDAPLVHAVACDPMTGDAVDILGRRRVGEVRAELTAAVGPLQIRKISAFGGGMDFNERLILQDIAAGLPWMPGFRQNRDLKAWGELVMRYAEARGMLE